MTEEDALATLAAVVDMMRRPTHDARCLLVYRCRVNGRFWLAVEAATLALDALKAPSAPVARHEDGR